MGTPIPSFDLGGRGPTLQFLHANGYPPDCYLPLLRRLNADFRVLGMLLRPLWKTSAPETIQDWTPFTEDILSFLEAQQSGPLIGMGHSIGATVTLRAALREPGRFRALVLIEPVLVPPARMLGWEIVRRLGLGDRLHPKIAGALKRRRHFDSLERALEGYRRRDVFRYFSDESLRFLLEGMTAPSTAGGLDLVFSPEWEARIYATGLRDWDIWQGLSRLAIPTLILRGRETDTFLEPAARIVQAKNRTIRLVELEKSTHLLPLEKPQEVSDLTRSFLREML
jgi:pimeloyl-ACP methyl ester carboxylesterase